MKTLVLAAGLLLAPFVQEAIYEVGPGVTAPVVVREVKPQYTPEAMRERVQGAVHLVAVVRPTGRVTDIAVKESLHSDLDKAAMEALAQWEFKPGTREGETVAVRVTIMMTFTLK
jgi:protein TonB